MGCAIGIDVHQVELTVAQHGGPVWTMPRTPAGLGRLTTRLLALAPAVIVREPSGGDEQTVLDALHAASLPVARVNPTRVRAWIEHALGVKTKTDPLDAALLARYGATAELRLTPPPTPAERELAQLVGLRRTLRDDLAPSATSLLSSPNRSPPSTGG